MFDKSTFCILPWSSIQINPSGEFKVCCFSGVSNETTLRGEDHGMCLDAQGNPMSIFTHTILEALNSQYHKQVRLAQSKNERHPLCKVCWDRDDASAQRGKITTSLRFFRSFQQLPALDNAISIDVAQDKITDDGSLDNEYPISLDLRFTNVCNMKCIMCSSRYSNQWYDDELKLYGRHNQPNLEYKSVNNSLKAVNLAWHDAPEWWEQFEIIKTRIRHLYLTGGEPFIVKGHDELLDRLIAADLAKNVILEYDTNLTVINDKILNRLANFKQVIISVSCDDVNEGFELIRFPGKFNTMLENLTKLRTRNISIRHLSSCIGIYSLFSPMKLYEYFKPLGYDTYSFRVLRAPDHSNIGLLPDHLKLRMIEIYEASTLPDKWKAFLCGYLENNLGKFTDEQCAASVGKHIGFLNKLDEIRGTDWKTTLPEVAELLHEYL